MPSGGRYFSRRDTGWRDRHRRGGAYDKGATAWECLSRDAYAYLKRTHGGYLDEWPRLRLLSFCVTLLTRHGRTFEQGRQATVDSHGTMSVPEFMSFRMVQCLDTTEQDIEDMVLSQTKDRLIVLRDSQGKVARLGCHQGHAGRVARQIDENELYTLVGEDDPDIQGEVMHGSFVKYAYPISRDGLVPGGRRGQKYRQHIHMVTRIHDCGAIPGLRSDADLSVHQLEAVHP